MQKNKSSSENSNFISTYVIILILLIVISFYIKSSHPKLWSSLYHVFLENTIQTIWNIVFLSLCLNAILRIWILPLWRLLFAETKKLGQKLEWYNVDFKHLSPATAHLFWARWGFVQFISLIFSLISLTINSRVILSFSEPYTYSKSTEFIQEASQTFLLNFVEFVLLFSFYAWFFTILEGRSRIVARILDKREKIKDKHHWKKPLPEIPWDMNSQDLELCIFSEFTNKEGLPTREETPYEQWVKLKKEAVVANILGIAPTGAGKTVSIIKPVIDQTIAWQHNNIEKKASLAVYDPKAELTEYVIDRARLYQRESDLIVLSLSSEAKINPLQVKNIWDGQTSWMIAGWIISGWQNYQGKSSPEPFWENQSFLLIRALLVIMYVYNKEKTTLYDVSKIYSQSTSGCVEAKDKKINEFGMMILKAFICSRLGTTERSSLYEILREYDYSKITNIEINHDLVASTKKRIKEEKEEYREKTRKILMNTHHTLLSLVNDASKATKSSEIEELRTSYHNIREELLEKEVKAKFPENKSSEHKENIITHIMIESEKLRDEIHAMIDTDNGKENASLIIKDSTEWLLNNWSQIPTENRSSIVSNMEPFLKMFETPEVKAALSPKNPPTNFDDAVLNGSIVVPSFPGIEIGQSLANAIVTLIKARWQYAVLANSNNKRVKFQIMDEAQRIITFGEGKNTGDFEYMELSRSFGGSTFMMTQSVSSLRGKAPREVDWEKVHGVVRSIICFGTNDPKTIELFTKIGGKEIKKRKSQTVTESANSPELEMISEKFKGDSGNLSISYTTSEAMEDTIQPNEIQGLKVFTAIAALFDGQSTSIKRIALKPGFWPEKRDTWHLMNKAEFNPGKRLEV